MPRPRLEDYPANTYLDPEHPPIGWEIGRDEQDETSHTRSDWVMMPLCDKPINLVWRPF